MTSPQPGTPTPDPAQDQLPPGSRPAGRWRTVTGWVLVALGVLAILGDLAGTSRPGTGSPLLGAALFILTGAALVWWGRSDRARGVTRPTLGHVLGTGAAALDQDREAGAARRHAAQAQRQARREAARAREAEAQARAAAEQAERDRQEQERREAERQRQEQTPPGSVETAVPDPQPVPPGPSPAQTVLRRVGAVGTVALSTAKWFWNLLRRMLSALSRAAVRTRQAQAARAKARREARAARPEKVQGPGGSVVMDISEALTRYTDFVENGRLNLYVMDKHKAAIHKIVRSHGRFVPDGRGGNGVHAAWGTVQAQPRNQYDPDAVHVLVDGKPVGYFSLDWKDVAHQWLHTAGHRRLVVPVVVRWWGQREYAWAFKSMADAQGFADWAARKDRR